MGRKQLKISFLQRRKEIVRRGDKKLKEMRRRGKESRVLGRELTRL